MFRRGLKEQVKDELMRDGRTIRNLTELIEIAIDLDDKLYERAVERKYDSRPGGRSGYIPKYPTYRAGRPADPYGHDPMELNITEKEGKS